MIPEKVRNETFDNGQSLIELSSGDIYATVALITTPQGYTSQWLVSRIGEEYSQAALSMNIPVFGLKKDIAERRVRQSAQYVFDLAEALSGGQSPVVGVSLEDRHLRLHLHKYAQIVDTKDVVKQAALLYEFLVSFRAFGPVQLLADELGVENIRTMQDRLDRARDRGQLERPGRGSHWV